MALRVRRAGGEPKPPDEKDIEIAVLGVRSRRELREHLERAGERSLKAQL